MINAIVDVCTTSSEIMHNNLRVQNLKKIFYNVTSSDNKSNRKSEKDGQI